MNKESILKDIEVVYRPGRKPINNILKLLANGKDQDIVDYLDNATLHNINVLGTFKNAEDLDTMNETYHKFVYKWIKEDNKNIINSLLNNGYNAFVIPDVIDTNNYYKGLNYTFFFYFKRFKNTLSSFKEKDKYISFFAHGLNQISSEDIDKYQDILSVNSIEKNKINLFKEPEIINLPVFQKNALRFFPIMSAMNEKEIGERLKIFRAEPDNEIYLSKVYSNIFVYRKKSSIKKIISSIFESVEDFNENFLNPYLYHINDLHEDIGNELLLLKKEGYPLKINNFDEKTYLRLIYSICKENNREENLQTLKEMGAKISIDDVSMNLFYNFSVNSTFKNNPPIDISTIFHKDEPVAQSILKKEAFIKVLKVNNNIVEKIEAGLDVIEMKTMENDHLSEMLSVVYGYLKEKRKSDILHTSTATEKDKILAMSTALLEQIKDRSDFMDIVTKNEGSHNILYGLSNYYVFPEPIVRKIKEESVNLFQHYMNALFNNQSAITTREALMLNIKNVFDWNIYPYCFENKNSEYPDVTDRNCLYLFVKLICFKINDDFPVRSVERQRSKLSFTQLTDEKEKEFFNYIMNEKPEQVEDLLRIAKGNETTDPKYEAYCQKKLLSAEKKLSDSFEVKKVNRI